MGMVVVFINDVGCVIECCSSVIDGMGCCCCAGNETVDANGGDDDCLDIDDFLVKIDLNFDKVVEDDDFVANVDRFSSLVNK